MPHKRNPVGAVVVVACAQRAPGLVATILAAMVQEHERAAGAWQSEWEPLLELLRLAGSAAATAGASCSRGSMSTPSGCAPTWTRPANC